MKEIVKCLRCGTTYDAHQYILTRGVVAMVAKANRETDQLLEQIRSDQAAEPGNDAMAEDPTSEVELPIAHAVPAEEDNADGSALDSGNVQGDLPVMKAALT